MKILTNIIYLLPILFILNGCLPDGLTKFKEDGVTNSTNDITSSDQLTAPTSLSYSSTTCTVNDECLILPSGYLGGLLPDSEDIVSNEAISLFQSSYTITPSLPSGVSINSSSGIISGIPSVPSPSATYTIILNFTNPVDQINSSLSATIIFSSEQGFPDDLRIKLTSPIGKQIQIDTPAANTFKTPFTNNDFSQIITDDGAIGNITSITATSIYISIVSGEFKIGDQIDNGNIFLISEGEITKITYFFETSESNNIFLEVTTDDINQSSILGANNGVTFGLSPDLNLTSGIPFYEASTGSNTSRLLIGYSSTEIDVSDYTLTVQTASAQNAPEQTAAEQFKRSLTFSIGIIDTPKNLTYSNHIVLKVRNASLFKVGNHISSLIQVPSATAGRGVVKYIKGNHIVLEVSEGKFYINQSIDNKETYADNQTKIEDVQFVNNILKVSPITNLKPYYDTTITNTQSSILCDGINSKHIITLVDTDNSEVYTIQIKRPSGDYSSNLTLDSASKSVSTNSTSCSEKTSKAGENAANVNITHLWSPFITGTIPSLLLSENDTIISDSIAGHMNLYANSILTTGSSDKRALFSILSPGLITHNTNFDLTPPYGNNDTQIENIETSLYFSLPRGKAALISPFMVEGSKNLDFTIDPELPLGLNFDLTTGEISGTPNTSSDKTSYTITAFNAIQEENIILDIEIFDYFSIENKVTSSSSYFLHQAGQNIRAPKCNISQKFIESGLIPDITCFLEVGELDLYELGLDIDITAGTSMCEFVEFQPFSYYQYRPYKTDLKERVYYLISRNSCDFSNLSTSSNLFKSTTTISSGAIDPATNENNLILLEITLDHLCSGNYDETLCDSGRYSYNSISITNDTSVEGSTKCSYEITKKDVNCGGHHSDCISGPKKDIALEGEARSFIHPSYSSIRQNYKFASPIERNEFSNKRLANFTNSNNCSNEINKYVYESQIWKNYTELKNLQSPNSGILSPFSTSSPYYEFYCLDSAYEVKAKIKLLVRDWNLSFDPSSNIDYFIDLNKMDASTNLDDNDIPDWDDTYSTSNATSILPQFNKSGSTCFYSTNLPAIGRSDTLVSRPGTVSGTISTNILNGDGSALFNTEISVGDAIQITGYNVLLYVQQINSDTEIILSSNLTSTFTGASYQSYSPPITQSSQTVSGTTNSPILTGTNTSFIRDVAAGSAIRISSSNNTFIQISYVKSVNSNTSLTLFSNLENDIVAGSLYQTFNLIPITGNVDGTSGDIFLRYDQGLQSQFFQEITPGSILFIKDPLNMSNVENVIVKEVIDSATIRLMGPLNYTYDDATLELIPHHPFPNDDI